MQCSFDFGNHYPVQAGWPACWWGAIVSVMSEKLTLDAVAERYFYLWQQQVTFLAQSPDSSFADLMEEGQRIARDLAPDRDPEAPSPEEGADTS